MTTMMIINDLGPQSHQKTQEEILTSNIMLHHAGKIRNLTCQNTNHHADACTMSVFSKTH